MKVMDTAAILRRYIDVGEIVDARLFCRSIAADMAIHGYAIVELDPESPEGAPARDGAANANAPSDNEGRTDDTTESI